MINPFGRHFCRPCDRRHIVAQMAGDEMSLTQFDIGSHSNRMAFKQAPAIINWLSNNCNLIGFNDCFDASANYQLLVLGICQLSIIQFGTIQSLSSEFGELTQFW